MEDLLTILNSADFGSPRRLAQRVEESYVTTMEEKGFVTFPIYTTSKKRENVEGIKFSDLREDLVNPSIAYDEGLRERISQAFNDSFYVLYYDRSNAMRFALFFRREHVSTVRNSGRYANIKPISKSMRNSKTESTSTTESKPFDETAVEPVVEPISEDNPKKSSKPKKSKK